jgi:hypothetical protein
MELAAILLAKTLAFVESADMNPHGSVFFPDLVKALVARYNFQTIPKTREETEKGKGTTFALGRFGNTVIEELTFFPFGITLSTRVSTTESRRLLDDAFLWGQKEFGLIVKNARWQYESQVTFHSKVPLTSMNPAAQIIAEVLARNAKAVTGDELKYELTAVQWEFDQLKRKYSLGRFSIQRRDNTPFSDNKYFSDAPLETEVHLKALEEFEAAVAKTRLELQGKSGQQVALPK